jgi:hypothetical protein
VGAGVSEANGQLDLLAISRVVAARGFNTKLATDMASIRCEKDGAWFNVRPVPGELSDYDGISLAAPFGKTNGSISLEDLNQFNGEAQIAVFTRDLDGNDSYLVCYIPLSERELTIEILNRYLQLFEKDLVAAAYLPKPE